MLLNSWNPIPHYLQHDITSRRNIAISSCRVGCTNLGDRVIASTSHVSLAVGEQVVDDHSDDGEEEDDETPEDLVGNGAVRLEDLDCATSSAIDQP